MPITITSEGRRFALMLGTVKAFDLENQRLILATGSTFHCLPQKYAKINPTQPIMVFSVAEPGGRDVPEVANLYNVGLTDAQFQKITIEISAGVGGVR
jgi:hypothetical protein